MGASTAFHSYLLLRTMRLDTVFNMMENTSRAAALFFLPAECRAPRLTPLPSSVQIGPDRSYVSQTGARKLKPSLLTMTHYRNIYLITYRIYKDEFILILPSGNTGGHATK